MNSMNPNPIIVVLILLALLALPAVFYVAQRAVYREGPPWSVGIRRHCVLILIVAAVVFVVARGFGL